MISEESLKGKIDLNHLVAIADHASATILAVPLAQPSQRNREAHSVATISRDLAKQPGTMAPRKAVAVGSELLERTVGLGVMASLRRTTSPFAHWPRMAVLSAGLGRRNTTPPEPLAEISCNCKPQPGPCVALAQVVDP
jgi:hypothetical protein